MLPNTDENIIQTVNQYPQEIDKTVFILWSQNGAEMRPEPDKDFTTKYFLWSWAQTSYTNIKPMNKFVCVCVCIQCAYM